MRDLCKHWAKLKYNKTILNKHLWLIEKLTSRSAALLSDLSPLFSTTWSASGRTFQNSLTKSEPFRLLFWRISFARYRKASRCSRGEQWNCLSHVSTTFFALFMWKIHQWDRAWLHQRSQFIEWEWNSNKRKYILKVRDLSNWQTVFIVEYSVQ